MNKRLIQSIAFILDSIRFMNLSTSIYQLLFFLMGIMIGSFLNVVIWRIPRGESIIRPRSHCPSCKEDIAPYDNIPLISWLILDRKCRHCKKPISPRYFLIELLSGLVSLIMVSVFGVSSLLLVYLSMLYLLIAISVIDFEHYIIPDSLILFGLALVISAHIFEALPISILNGIYGALVFAGTLFLIGIIGEWILKKESMGLGDVKLGFVIGGLLGLESAVLVLFLSFLLATFLTVMGMLFFKLDGKGKIPFAPFMAGACLIVFLTSLPNGQNLILGWYFSFLYY